MKSLTLLLIPLLLFMTGCSIDWNDEKDKKITELEKQVQNLTNTVQSYETEKSGIFVTKSFGVSFESFYGSGIFSISSPGSSPAKIQYITNDSGRYYYPIIDPLEIFYRENMDQSPKERIMKIVKDTGSNPDNCIVLESGTDELGFNHLMIDLKEKNIKYTISEKKELEQSKKDVEKTGGPEYIFTEATIYNKRLLKECGKYAIGVPPATSKTYGSSFISSSGTLTILYHPSGADPSIIKWGTLKLFDPISE